MTRPPTVLVTGAGGPGGVNLTRGLALWEGCRVVGTDCDPWFVHLSVAHDTRLVPHSGEEEPYLRAIDTIIRDEGVDVVVPSNSIEARVLSRRRDDLACAVLLPSLDALDIADSKWRTYEALRAEGLPVPESVSLDDPSNCEEAFARLGPRDEEGRVWVRGAGIPGRGIGAAALPARSHEVARAWVDHYDGWGAMMASEYLPGANMTWLGVFVGGRLVTSQGRERLRYVIPHVTPSGITGAPAVSRTISRGDLDELGRRACLALDPALDGVCFVDFKGDGEGRLHITETNAGRFGTTSPWFYAEAGCNVARVLVQVAMGGEPSPSVPTTAPLPDNIYWIRTLDAGPVLLDGGEIRRVTISGG